MKNVSTSLEGNILVIRVDLSKDFGPSKSTGKTTIIATSEGNQSLPFPGYEDVKFGSNIYKPRQF